MHEAIDMYWKSSKWSLNKSIDPQTQEFVISITMFDELPTDLEAIVGDVLGNLRSALNLLIADMVRANGQAVSRQNAFPSAASHSNYKREAPRRLENISDKARHFINRLRPYTGGNSLFWQLAELRNTDEHQYIMPVVIGRAGIKMRAAHPMTFISPNGNLCIGGGPPGSVPYGHEQEPMTPSDALNMELGVGISNEIYRGHPNLIHLNVEPSVNLEITIGHELGPLDILHDFKYLVGRVISIAQRRLGPGIKRN
jgi:hypothetical protein